MDIQADSELAKIKKQTKKVTIKTARQNSPNKKEKKKTDKTEEEKKHTDQALD